MRSWPRSPARTATSMWRRRWPGSSRRTSSTLSTSPRAAPANSRRWWCLPCATPVGNLWPLVKPGHLLALRLLEAGDIGLVALREGDRVGPLQQHGLAEGIDLEGVGLAVRSCHRLLLEIDRDLRARQLVQDHADARHALGRQADRHAAVLEAVVEEDVAERGRDEGAIAVVYHHRDSVLARRAAGEVEVADHDPGV